MLQFYLKIKSTREQMQQVLPCIGRVNFLSCSSDRASDIFSLNTY